MFTVEKYSGSKEENYQLALKQLKALIEGVDYSITNLANAAALLNQLLDQINWVGFYLTEGDKLRLGPFQGLPACVEIPFGKGVCGTAASNQETLRVADVNQFPGHIACDSASQSEIVVPMIKDGTVIGVLDIDSPILERFDEIDQKYLEEFVSILIQSL